ncbi:hypothetical protein U8V72_27445 [Priestia filamentosa]|uniref:hypothetical protein n=1 Tax=Priestia filamentosa TaxID=1402861 RepID=UPI00397A9900
MTNNNPFLNMLNEDIFEVGLSKKEIFVRKNSNYMPSKLSINKLLGDNYQIISFINKYNPFSESTGFLRASIRGEVANDVQNIFPLTHNVIDKLSEEAFDNNVVPFWKEGIKNNIIKYSDSIEGKKELGLTIDDLIFTFTEPIISLTKKIILKRNTYAEEILDTIHFNAAQVTPKLGSSSEKNLNEYYEFLIKRSTITEEDIQLYKKLKYKPLDLLIHRLLNSNKHGDNQKFLEAMSNIPNLLLFVDIPVSSLLSKSQRRFQLVLDQLRARLTEMEQALEQKQNPDYKNKVYEVVKDINKNIYDTEHKFKTLQRNTEQALKVLSKVHETYQSERQKQCTTA